MTISPKPRHLLASDLDGTLIPPGAGPAGSVERFRERLRASPEVVLAYVTGRHHELALEGIRDAGLPEPAFLVCDVGTSIRQRGDGVWRLDEVYRDRMREALAGLRAEELRARLDGLDLTLQKPERQAEFKSSWTFPAERAESDVEAEVRARIQGLPVRTVLSREAKTGLGLLDLLPEGVAKDTAVRHLRDRLALAHADVLYAGDSGNDRDALLGGWRAVLVGNAPQDMRDELRGEAARRGLADRIHLARAHLADGVLEACERFGWFGPAPA